MEINEVLAILMFVSFIGLLFVGFPVAWTLGGIGIIFAAISIIVVQGLAAAGGRTCLDASWGSQRCCP